MIHLSENSLSSNNYKRVYSCRDDQVRAEISKEEAIDLILHKYHAEYDPDHGLDGCFDAWDQLLTCEAVAESTPITPRENDSEDKTNESVSVNGNDNGNGTCKFGVNFELTESKLQVISDLKKCNSKTSSSEIAKLLEVLFQEYESKRDHWLWIAQRWTPRTINWSVNYILKLHSKGRIRKTPPACFTDDIKHRKQRKGL